MIAAETLAEWKREAGTVRPRQFGKTIAGRTLALIAEIERLQEAHRSTRTLAEWNADQASVTAERCNKACAERDALQAQVDAVKALHLSHRASTPSGFEDLCVCLGCKMARALGEGGDES